MVLRELKRQWTGEIQGSLIPKGCPSQTDSYTNLPLQWGFIVRLKTDNKPVCYNLSTLLTKAGKPRSTDPDTKRKLTAEEMSMIQEMVNRSNSQVDADYEVDKYRSDIAYKGPGTHGKRKGSLKRTGWLNPRTDIERLFDAREFQGPDLCTYPEAACRDADPYTIRKAAERCEVLLFDEDLLRFKTDQELCKEMYRKIHGLGGWRKILGLSGAKLSDKTKTGMIQRGCGVVLSRTDRGSKDRYSDAELYIVAQMCGVSLLDPREREIKPLRQLSDELRDLALYAMGEK
jgi:hypothetical protein